MRGAILVGLASVVLGLPSAAAAQSPATGWWRGVNADGVRVSFAVVRHGDGRAITSIVVGCDDFGRVYASAAATTDVLFHDRAGEYPTGEPNALAAYPLRASGEIDSRSRRIRAPAGHWYGVFEPDYEARPILSGRLGGRGGRVMLRDYPSTSNACAHHSPTKGDVIDVAAVGGNVRPGVWRVKGLLPFGDVADYATAKFFLQPSGIAASFRGMFLGPSPPPPSAPRPDPLYSPWPAPCFDENVSDSMQYDFNETFMVHYGLVAPDGSMSTPGWSGPDVPGGYQWVTTSGHFDSPTHYSGTYEITEDPALTSPNWCVDVPIPFEAGWERAASPIIVGSLHRHAPRAPQPTPVLPVPPRPLNYVALGDSYSSGEGVPPFDAGTDTADNACHRSAYAYSRVLDLPGYRFQRSFVACSGAVTDNVGRLDPASGQIAGTVQYPSETAVQLARLGAPQWQATDMVTLTIGGNDAQFGPVLKQCIALPCQRGRLARRIVDRIAREVPPKLAATYSALAHTAPNATVFVLGYPQLFPDRPRARCPVGKRVVSRAKQAFLRERGEQLNRLIRREAAKAGFHYVDVEREFRGHEPCGPKSEWIHALVLRGGVVYSFHPNRAGQAGYARELQRYVLCLAGQHWKFLSSGIPGNPRGRRVPSACRR